MNRASAELLRAGGGIASPPLPLFAETMRASGLAPSPSASGVSGSIRPSAPQPPSHWHSGRPARSEASKARSCATKPGLGETTGRAARSAASASSNPSPSRPIRKASTSVAARDTPPWQCTRTVPPAARAAATKALTRAKWRPIGSCGPSSTSTVKYCCAAGAEARAVRGQAQRGVRTRAPVPARCPPERGAPGPARARVPCPAAARCVLRARAGSPGRWGAHQVRLVVAQLDARGRVDDVRHVDGGQVGPPRGGGAGRDVQTVKHTVQAAAGRCVPAVRNGAKQRARRVLARKPARALQAAGRHARAHAGRPRLVALQAARGGRADRGAQRTACFIAHTFWAAAAQPPSQGAQPRRPRGRATHARHGHAISATGTPAVGRTGRDVQSGPFRHVCSGRRARTRGRRAICAQQCVGGTAHDV